MFVDFDFFLCSCDTTVMWMADSEEGPQLESQYMQIKRIGDPLQMLRYTLTSIFSNTWPITILARVDSNNHSSTILLPLSIFFELFILWTVVCLRITGGRETSPKSFEHALRRQQISQYPQKSLSISSTPEALNRLGSRILGIFHMI